MNFIEEIVTSFFHYLNSKGKIFNTVIGLAWTAFFGALDLFAPAEYTFSFLYLLPISFVTWFAGKRYGFIIALGCAGVWSIRNILNVSISVAVWNVISTLAIFIAVSVLLSKIRQLWENDIALSRTDPLTGVMNVRALSELVDYEILRIQRESSKFSFVYIDIDNFKYINDYYGHKKGDELLKAVTATLVKNLRKTDVVARVGGDEFTIFLPATDNEAVTLVIQNVREALCVLVNQNNWPISFSMGVVTCNHGTCEFSEVMSKADGLMYEVKKSGKDNIRFGVLDQDDAS